MIVVPAVRAQVSIAYWKHLSHDLASSSYCVQLRSTAGELCTMETFEPRQLDATLRRVFCSGRLEEFCQLETFEPECWKNEVIVIEKAIYGRHRVGKCIAAEEAAMRPEKRFFGCSTDVKGLLDAKCSGRKRCQVRIPDADLERTEPCLRHLKMFLEVSYTCVEGLYSYVANLTRTDRLYISFSV